jgi:hypothetical protein
MGHVEYGWQDIANILEWFEKILKQDRKVNQRFVDQGIVLSRQSHLVGGGPMRSEDRWPEIKTLRRIGSREKVDQRILGWELFFGTIFRMV